jgi:hypothetical protein
MVLCVLGKRSYALYPAETPQGPCHVTFLVLSKYDVEFGSSKSQGTKFWPSRQQLCAPPITMTVLREGRRMARHLSGTASRFAPTWQCRQLSTSASTSAASELTELESTTLAQSTVPLDESAIQTFNERQRSQKDRYLPGNRFATTQTPHTLFRVPPGRCRRVTWLTQQTPLDISTTRPSTTAALCTRYSPPPGPTQLRGTSWPGPSTCPG